MIGLKVFKNTERFDFVNEHISKCFLENFACSIIVITLMLVSGTALAGGSIFGGHKTRTSNPDGVSSIGIHICGSLNCPDVILKKGDCGEVEHATVKYGVCVCDDGYQVKDGECVCDPAGLCCPGNSTETEISGGTSFEVTGNSKSMTCWCPEGQSYQENGCALVPTTPCNDYESNVCGLGYYCQATSPVCDEGGNGTCTKISSDNNNEGEKSPGGYWIGPKMDWFSANSWCIGKGRPGLIFLNTLNIGVPDEEFGYCDFPDHLYYVLETGYSGGLFENEAVACKTVGENPITMTPDNAYATYGATLKNKIGSDKYWTNNVFADDFCKIFVVTLSNSDARVRYHNRNHNILEYRMKQGKG